MLRNASIQILNDSPFVFGPRWLKRQLSEKLALEAFAVLVLENANVALLDSYNKSLPDEFVFSHLSFFDWRAKLCRRLTQSG